MRAAAAAIAAVLALPAAAPASERCSYTTIAGGSETRTLGQCPAISELGAVAFTASDLDPETFDTSDAMLRGSGGRLTTIAREGGRLDAIVGNPSINALGAVAFDAIPADDDRELILRGSGGPLTEIARSGEERRFDSFTADVSLNLLGRVAFTGEVNADGDEGLFEGAGGPVATRYLASASPFAGSIGQPSLNDREQVAFTEEIDLGVQGVFRQGPGGGVTTIADDTGELEGFNSRVSLNNLGQVAFTAFGESGEAVHVGRRHVADTAGEFAFFGFGGPSLNDRGQVAFQATLDDFASEGVFTDAGPVLRTGDVLGGRTVASVTGCREMLNVRGQVALKVFFEDGAEAVVRADPRR